MGTITIKIMIFLDIPRNPHQKVMTSTLLTRTSPRPRRQLPDIAAPQGPAELQRQGGDAQGAFQAASVGGDQWINGIG